MIFAANWKLNKNPQEATTFVEEILASTSLGEQSKIILIPQALCLAPLLQAIGQSGGLRAGMQNCYLEEEGAYTGENSAKTAQQMGCRFVLVGHSERRQIFKETNENLALKLRLVQQVSMTPILCVGETLEQRKADQTESVILEQLKMGLSKCVEGAEVIVAYEPVWAIGTGQVATPEQAQEVHSLIRHHLRALIGDESAEKCSLLYGGSVKPENCAELAKKSEINGFLIGGASLKSDSLVSILRNSAVKAPEVTV